MDELGSSNAATGKPTTLGINIGNGEVEGEAKKWQRCSDDDAGELPSTSASAVVQRPTAISNSIDSMRRENILFVRLAAKEQEVQDCYTQLEELRASNGSLRQTLLDPIVNTMFQKIKHELRVYREKLDQSQQDMNAWKFTPDSITGKKLMARCRRLIQENEELGKATDSGRIANLQAQLAATRTEANELKRGQQEVDEFLLELDEDMEGLQATVVYLQDQFDATKRENWRLRTMCRLGDDDTSAAVVGRRGRLGALAEHSPRVNHCTTARGGDFDDDDDNRDGQEPSAKARRLDQLGGLGPFGNGSDRSASGAATTLSSFAATVAIDGGEVDRDDAASMGDGDDEEMIDSATFSRKKRLAKRRLRTRVENDVVDGSLRLDEQNGDNGGDDVVDRGLIVDDYSAMQPSPNHENGLLSNPVADIGSGQF